MQKACIAIIFALAVSCAFAADPAPIATGWAKTPVSVCDDNLYNCTNRSILALGGLTTSDVNVISYDLAVNTTTNMSDCTWNLWTKVVDTKALTSTSNTSYGFKAPLRAGVVNGYAAGFDIQNDSSSVPQLVFYQSKITGGAVLPRVQLTTNKNASFTPSQVGYTSNTKFLFVFFTVTPTQVNYTTVVAGASAPGKEFTLTSTWNATNSRQVTPVWGEAIASAQIYCGWIEGETYKVATADSTSGTLIGAANLGAYNSTWKCTPYVTDKKYYGVWCRNVVNTTYTEVWVSANTTTLVKMFSFNGTASTLVESFPYSGYLGFFYSSKVDAGLTLSHETWDVEKFVTFRNKTDYLTYNATASDQLRYRIPSAGFYSMIWNKPANTSDPNSTKTKVQVGLLLEGSYLTTIFGSLMAIIAGLLLF